MIKKMKICLVVLVLLGGGTNSYLMAGESIKVNTEKITERHQYPELPTGCEITAATMLLNHTGLKVTKEEVAEKLHKVRVPYYEEGERRGPHPNEGFIGDPHKTQSYGVYVPPILEVIEKFLPGRSEDLRGYSLNEILEVVDTGRPVMIWATIGMIDVSYTQSWKLKNGEIFWWPNNEHAVVVVGYDEKWIDVIDPYSGQEKKYAREKVNARYNSLGQQAVAILPEEQVLALSINNETDSTQKARPCLKKGNKLLIPLCYVELFGIDTSYSYVGGSCKWQVPGVKEPLTLKGDKGVYITRGDKGKLISVYYEIEQGVTRILLEDLLQFGTFKFKVKGDTLFVEV